MTPIITNTRTTRIMIYVVFTIHLLVSHETAIGKTFHIVTALIYMHSEVDEQRTQPDQRLTLSPAPSASKLCGLAFVIFSLSSDSYWNNTVWALEQDTVQA